MSDFDFKSSGVPQTSPVFSQEVTPTPIGFITPLRLGSNRSGIFEMTFDARDQVKDNLKNLLLTNHGERMGIFKYGANLRPLVGERVSQDDFDALAMESIKEAISTFMPYVEPITFTSSIEAVDPSSGLSQVTITLSYDVPSLRMRDNKTSVTINCMG
jgi:phage baseplate assembly protein W